MNDKLNAEQLKADVDAAIASCIEKVNAGEYRTKNEAIDAIIADLEAMKESEGMGGLGSDEKMEIPGESGGEEADEE